MVKSRIQYFILLLLFAFLYTGCSYERLVTNRKLENTLGPYVYHFNGIQSRLYGDLVTAIELQKKSLLFDPSNAAAYYELSLCYGGQEDYTNAIINLEVATQLEPQNKYYRHYLGVLYLETNQIEKAFENQKLLIKLDSTSFSYRFSLALLQKDLGKNDESLNELNKLTNEFGFIPQVADAKIKLLFELNLLNEAQIEIEKLISHSPDVPIYQLYNSELFFRIGEDSLGYASLEKASEMDPENIYIKINKYLRLKESGYHLQSIALLGELIKSSKVGVTEKIELLYPLVYDKLYNTKYLNDLGSFINEIKTMYPLEMQVFALSYEFSLNQKNIDGARESLNKILEIDDKNPENWERAITFDFSFGNMETAIVNSQKAILLFPQNQIFYVLKALAFDNLSETDMAIEILEKGAKSTSSDKEGQSEVYATLADLYYKKNDVSNAFSNYKKSLRSNPNNARSLNNYSYYLSVRKQNLSKALKMSSKAVDLDPNNSTFIDTKGWVLFQLGKYEEAIIVLRNAISKGGSTNAVINEHYADALYKSGNKEGAYIYWLKAKELGGGTEKLLQKIMSKSYVP